MNDDIWCSVLVHAYFESIDAMKPNFLEGIVPQEGWDLYARYLACEVSRRRSPAPTGSRVLWRLLTELVNHSLCRLIGNVRHIVKQLLPRRLVGH